MALHTPQPIRSGVARRLLRAPLRLTRGLWRAAQPWPTPSGDSWALAPQTGQGAGLRRLAGLGALALLTLVGLSFLGTLTVLLGIGVASGSDLAGWLLGLTLLLAVVLLVWARGRLRQWQAQAHPLPASDELGQLRALHAQARALPRPDRAAVLGALQATAQALQVTGGGGTLTRDAFDARQAAREDLPELLAAARSGRGAVQPQLQLIETRMAAIAERGRAAQARAAQAQAAYLQDKYAPGKTAPEETAFSETGGKSPPRR
ncbi:hypothetical protein [Deinococcus aquaedulcis]|uniref:hypothetical protein n=1 Tax=Deinococcus aquaedulcis TaxID=2840455 RepID=UPI001C83CF74|nr:hypothetical protein [Deinococcus aquaedulcis]